MNIRTFLTSFAVCCAAMILAAMTVSPQDPEEMEAAFAEAMEKYASPSVEHEILAKRVGQWKTSTKFWMDPNGPPQVHEGESTTKMIMDGRYLFQQYKMNFNGMSFEGIGLTAYDRMKGEYQTIWIDNMGTGILWATGKETNGEFVYKGTAPDMMTGKYVSSRTVERMVNDDTILYEMYSPGPDGKEFKSMEITYTRSDSAPSAPLDRRSEQAILKEIVVDATLEQVWHAWTTREGLSTFFSGQSNVDHRIGGAYELFQDLPPDRVGISGTAGCSVLSYIPFEMLSFEWGFPQDIPGLRYSGVRTHVVLRFDPIDENTTRIRLAHLGWYPGEDWDRAFEYFEQEWAEALERLRDNFSDEADSQVIQQLDQGRHKLAGLSGFIQKGCKL